MNEKVDGAQRASSGHSAVSDRGSASWSLEALLFEVEARRFALPARDVAEVLRAVAMRSLPKAPSIVEGIVNLRGQIVPVLDLRARFGLPRSALRASDHFIIAMTGARRVALRVDRALSIAELDALPIEHATHLPSGVGYVAGIATVAGDIVLIHDVRAFLSDAEAFELDSALAHGSSTVGS